MKILQICNTDFYLNNFLSSLVASLKKKGFIVDCVCEGNEVSTSLKKDINKLIDFRYPKVSSIIQFIMAIVAMYRLIKRGGYDVVNSHNRNASIVGRIACFIARKPINIYTAHGCYFHDAQSSLAYNFTVLLELVLAKTSDCILSQSNEDTIKLSRISKSIGSKIKTIGNGIDVNKFYKSNNRVEEEKELGLSHDTIRIVCVGRIVKNKGYQDVVKALSYLKNSCNNIPKTELLIVGGNIKQEKNSVMNELLSDIESNNLSNEVVITGLVSNVNKYLAVSDIFVSASYREGMPRSVIEGQASCMPIIATNIRGCREIVSPGSTGYLYKKSDIEELSKLLLELIVDDDKRNNFGIAGRKNAVENYTEEEYVKIQTETISYILGDINE